MSEKILYGGPPSPPFADPNAPFGAVILQKLAEHGNQIILIESETGTEYTAKYLHDQILRFVECLKHLGLTDQDTLGLCSENRFEFLVVLFSTFCIGATIATISPSYTHDELSHSMQLSKPKIVISSKLKINLISELADKRPYIQKVITLDKAEHNSDILEYALLMKDKQIPLGINNWKCAPIDDNKTIVILCSSGTTGLPKGAEITKLNVFFMLTRIISILEEQRTTEPNGYMRAINVLPWFHSYGLMISIILALAGITNVTCKQFKETVFYSAIQKYKPNLATIVPPILVLLAKSSTVDSYDLSSLTRLLSGAAPLRKETIEAINKRFPKILLTQGYGLSETALSVLMCNESNTKGSVGSLQLGTWGKVIDSDTGEILGANNIGELCFKGNLIMKGYIGNSSASSQTIDNEGWLHTGDIGYYNENQEWFVVDRIKELIKYKGYQVPPAELESILLTHPKIADAAVIGLPDDGAGELPLAFVVKKPNTNPSEREIYDFVAGKTSNPKHLRGGVQFISAIPKNLTGKILRRKLKEMVVENIAKSKL